MTKDIILQIPKNASSSFSKIRRRSEKVLYYVSDFDNTNLTGTERFHVILRDPLTRWLSAVLEFAYLHRSKKIKEENIRYEDHQKFLAKILKEKFLSKLKLLPIHASEGHTLPQHTFIPKGACNTIFYALEDPESLELLNKTLGLFPNKWPVVHTSASTLLKILIGEMFYPEIDETLLQKVRTFYRKDYELYTTNFPHLPLEQDPANYLRRIGCNI